MTNSAIGRRRCNPALACCLAVALATAPAALAALAANTANEANDRNEASGQTATAARPGAAAATAATAAAAVHTRQEIHQLTAAQIDAYRKGVALMQSRTFSDPTSWVYQANMHGYPTNNAICQVVGTPQPAWSTCQHGSFFFLAWHRMYLYYFERILRQAVRDATKDPNYNFALPFWDYENADYHALPEPFRNPANASNPLYVAQRAANCNSGAQCVSASDASDSDAMGLIPFCNCPSGSTCAGCKNGIASDESFGGQFTPAPNHSGSGPGELELQPHGVVHVAVGGNTGWMSYFICAARDPIFWLHHANIDRLWQVWLNQGGGRANPIANGEWTKQTFTFFDEKGKAVTMTACQILNTATQLDYEYQGVPVSNVTLCGGGTVSAAKEAPQPTAAARKVLASSAGAATSLGSSPVSVDVALPAAAGQRVHALAAGGEARRVRLEVQGIKLVHPGGIYQVYLNLPQGQAPDPAGPYFLGNIALFADPEHAGPINHGFDITSRLKSLPSDKVHLTIVRERLGGATAEANEPKELLRFTKVALIEE